MAWLPMGLGVSAAVGLPAQYQPLQQPEGPRQVPAVTARVGSIHSTRSAGTYLLHKGEGGSISDSRAGVGHGAHHGDTPC